MLAGVSSFALGTFSMIIAPWAAPFSHPWLRAVQVDRYYQLLVPLTVPVTILAVSACPAAGRCSRGCPSMAKFMKQMPLYPADLHELVQHEAVQAQLVTRGSTLCPSAHARPGSSFPPRRPLESLVERVFDLPLRTLLYNISNALSKALGQKAAGHRSLPTAQPPPSWRHTTAKVRTPLPATELSAIPACCRAVSWRCRGASAHPAGC